MNSETVLEKEM